MESIQSELSPSMRAVLIDWMVEVAQVLGLPRVLCSP